MKVTVIGAGSTYTPELVSGLWNERERLTVDELWLMDVDGPRLEIVGGMVRRMLARQGADVPVTVTTDRTAAIDGSDAVLIQLRVGGQSARLQDELFPLACGCVGQETTGAGGLAKALRTVPVVLDIAREARERANPGAWIVDFTNPVGINTRALLDDGHRAIGLCNFAIGVQRWIAREHGVEPHRVEVDPVGLNHLSWVRHIRVDGVDVLPGMIAERSDDLGRRGGVPGELIRDLGVLPSYYLKYYYAHDATVAEMVAGTPRATVVADVERELLALYADPTVDTKPPQLEARGGAFYSEAATALLASLVAGTGDNHVVNVRNNGLIPGLADGDVVETLCRVDASGATPLPQEPVAPELLGLIQHVSAYERLAARAAVTGDRQLVRKALLTHPLVGQWDLVTALEKGIFETGGQLLPQFA
ncbi:6-phospho-beta-glucosidase [Leifsonia sp. 1010]|uniref:6-phospho-beta-glucosidase n=1 Tax=Leifsonia sp. 1010 TaxID=2817769 RepID=UPI00285D8A50|nr:6-phospho-beta-glucosidase [Leifsonia sp. 1010]MDR6611367.1 6-phospho-beta-glucosidase [Leifsonia sp. 1010]